MIFSIVGKVIATMVLCSTFACGLHCYDQGVFNQDRAIGVAIVALSILGIYGVWN